MLMKTDAVSGANIEPGWIPEIDGLRAVAILAVLVHHSNTALFTNWALGNVGVAIFFSISGFLAYFVLWKDERRLGKIDYNYFLLRRVLRIWPAYFAIIAVAYIIASPAQRALANEISLFTFTSNWHLASIKTPMLSTLGALWSIAVEEQFYVLAPFMYLALRSRHWLAFTVAIVACSNIGRAAYMLYCGPTVPYTGLYFTTFPYADIFLGGALAAKWFTGGGRLTRSANLWLATTSIIAIIGTLRLWGPIVWPPYNPLTLLPYPLLAIAGPALLVSASASKQTPLNMILASAPLRFFGKLSFSLYLVHVLIITELQNLLGMTFGGAWINLFVIPLSLLAAAILYYGIERPFLMIKTKLKPTPVIWPSIIIWALLSIGAVRYFMVT
jgi:peptidoglycan/LPS O-acetylase OafA/YrhL